jgi:hypothetical protein
MRYIKRPDYFLCRHFEGATSITWLVYVKVEGRKE